MLFLLATIAGAIDPVELQEACQQIEQDPHFRMVRNVFTQNPNHPVARNWDVVRSPNFHFSHEVTYPFPATNQKSSGRCWIFGSLNMLRGAVAKKIDVTEFEFSQSYLFFYDKIEKANMFLERMMETFEEPLDSPIVRNILSRLVEDGGTWHNVVDLVKKYGLVPKSVYPETEASNLSLQMNKILQMVLLKDAEILRNLLADGYTMESLRGEKEQMMREVYQILVVHMGAPPTTFDFSYYDKDKKFHIQKNHTPRTFAKEYIDYPLEDYVTLVNSPRDETPYYQNLRVAHSNQMVGGKEYTALNIPIDQLKAIAKNVLLDDRPVAFAADVNNQTDRMAGLFNDHLYEFAPLYQIDFTMNKGSRLLYRLSLPNHLMVFTGVHLEDATPIRWKVENSWGTDVGKQGFFSMSDKWFDEYLFDVVVPKKHLPEDLQQLLNTEPILLEPWDPLAEHS